MDLHSSNTFGLLKNGLLYDYPSLSSDVTTDIVIMGGGITGALVAWHLVKNGFNVIVVDKRHVGTGSTAASTSLLQYEIDVPLYKLIDRVGKQNAVRSYKLCIDAIHRLQEICNELHANVEFELKHSIQYASYKKHVKELHQEYVVRKKHGIEVTWLSAEHVQRKLNLPSPAALLSNIAGQVDAFKLTHALLHRSSELGLKVYDNTEITDIRHVGKRVILSSRHGHTINARHLVIACGYESQKYIPKKVEQLNATYAIVSEPLAEKTVWYKNSLLWETATPYLYLRVTNDKRILIGGKDEKFVSAKKRDSQIDEKARSLQRAFHHLFPEIPFKRDFQWAGTFSSTKDGLPFIGSIPQRPQTSFALGFGGNGITFSVIAANVICDFLRGKKNRDGETFSFER
jgi:glycine/D-amino acid oxidase-like deaminating enzyme